MTHQPKISVVIPVYKKADMVLRNLAHNKQFFKDYEVILVDDASGDELPRKMKKLYPEARVLVNKHNRGFGPTVNRGVKVAKGDFVILLGTDVRLIRAFPDPETFTRPFTEDYNVFALSFAQKERDGKTIGKNTMYFKRGLPNHHNVSDITAGRNSWADGGSSIIRKEHFIALGGFQEMYAPFYWEDNDLSYRAYSRGWVVYFTPVYVVEHHHESTINTFYDKKKVHTIAYRNQFLFTWSNVTDVSLWIQHLFWLPYYLLVHTVKGDRNLIKGFLLALKKLPQALKARSTKVRHQKVSDSRIFKSF